MCCTELRQCPLSITKSCVPSRWCISISTFRRVPPLWTGLCVYGGSCQSVGPLRNRSPCSVGNVAYGMTVKRWAKWLKWCSKQCFSGVNCLPQRCIRSSVRSILGLISNHLILSLCGMQRVIYWWRECWMQQRVFELQTISVTWLLASRKGKQSGEGNKEWIPSCSRH